MTLLLFRLYNIQVSKTGKDGEPTGELEDYTESRLMGEVNDIEQAREQIRDNAYTESDMARTAPLTVPTNRFAVYEPTGDVDEDGFPDGFRFLEILTASPPKPQPPTVRKGSRRT